ncbi:nucleoside kinase [Inconstantimicrobium mannanitabidum]|uniref:Threonyl-tRNA synthetase/uridine kinase n=1 Tax=Inconstantimicrobium mannanitabidum TaxID=1604901 RepID=A0ACB5RF75_9CLOT|nr:nucleoside kinase [Clostridium sp. TW13]GKX67768.1 threonyl-tRNA synthetase/uridine kinase [Clostridium sp. TW13]
MIKNIIRQGKKETKFYSCLDIEKDKNANSPILAKYNNKYYELGEIIPEDGEIEFVGSSDKFGNRAYVRALQFVLIKATLDLFPQSAIAIEHSISKGMFGEIYKVKALDEDDINKIRSRMLEIIEKDIIINKVKIKRIEAINIFEQYGMKDKVALLNESKKEYVSLYELDGRYDYFYGQMAHSTGVLRTFDLIYYEPGFILRYPEIKKEAMLPEFVEQKKLFSVFYETGRWLKILDVAHVSSLNNKINCEERGDLIRVAEALHEKKIANIADMIHERKEVKLVLIAGPSSSGKTTFANRLGIQLRVNGLIPIAISLDNYFVNREQTPLDDEGKPDFESLNALDLKLFNDNLNSLLAGEEVEIPTYNFISGQREWDGKKLKLPANGVIVIEGIHGLNDKLTSEIESKFKFKIYISALTQLNIDNHNRISTTDVRKIRRIVRDYLSRGYSAEGTLEMWDSIKRGEEKNIFVYQEEADIMFNSTLVYELCVLKKYALQELNKIDVSSELYQEARRLISFLNFFQEIDKDSVPENSILREFIGGSCFYKY